MKITRKTNVFVTTERKFIVRRLLTEEFKYCAQCGEQMISAQATADFFGISSRHIYRLIEAEKIHFAENAVNEMYVCPVSVKPALIEI